MIVLETLGMAKTHPDIEAEKFGKRLIALLEASGQPRHGSGAYLKNRYKVSGVTANAWINGTHRPEPAIAKLIADDHGSTFDELYFGTSESGGGKVENDSLLFIDKVVGARLSAGAGEVLWDFEQIDKAHAFRMDWMQAKRLRPDRCKVWTVSGDSMDPKYPHGSWVLINMAERDPVHGRNFALIGTDGLRLKQLRRSELGGWLMHSLNADQARYPPEPIVDDNYAIIGRVRAHGGDDE